MIASAALAEWLSDPVRQDASHQRSRAFASRWLNHPLFLDQARIKNESLTSIEGALAAARLFMDRDEDIKLLFDELITQAAADPFFRPPFSPLPTGISRGFILFHNDAFAILANVISADAVAAKNNAHGGFGTVGFTGMVTLYRYLKAGNAVLSLWQADEADASFSSEVIRQARMVGHRRIRDGESWIMDGRRESFIIEHASSDIVQLQAQVKIDCAPLAVEYDVKTGAFSSASATDEASSRIQMMVTLLRLMGREDAGPLVEQLLASPHFFTRWHLMREFLAINADAALPHLRLMADHDPHPEVRAAARQTLDMFFSNANEGSR